MEISSIIHTQEVTGSSPVAPTIHFKQIQTEGRVGGSGCDVDCDVKSQFAFLNSGWLVAEGPPIRPLSSFSSAVRFAAMRTWLQCSSIRRDM